MGGFRGVDSFGANLKGNIDAVEKDFETSVDEVVLLASLAAEDAMHRTIDETESALSPGKPNRNWTFTMNHSITSRVKQAGRRRTIWAGWLDRKEQYFLVQDQGGTVNGRPVWPMHALLNGFNAMRAEIDKGMRKIEKGRGR